MEEIPLESRESCDQIAMNLYSNDKRKSDHSIESINNSISRNNRISQLPDDLLIIILSFLDIKCLESLGFVFKPSKLLELNLQTNIIWKSCDSYHKLNSTENKIQIIDRIFNEKSFQKEIFKRQDLVVVNVLSNYCKLCNTFIKPNKNFFSKKSHFIICNHILF